MAGGFCYTYEYRPDGKLLKKWNSGKQVISCDYYKNGDLKSLTEYDYTAAGRTKEIRTSNGITMSYDYDGDGNISRLTIGNGTEEGLLYDAFMLYDLNGNRLSKQRYHYAHNATGDMDSVIDDEESYCYNERNEPTQRKNLLSVTDYIYDENGSLTKEKESEKETGYRYDLLNRQTHVHLPDGREQENLYDGEGLRAGLTENGKSTTFLFYNGEILAECDGDSMPIRRHLTGQGLSHVQNLENDTFHAYHQDEQGSTAYVTGSTGETENLYSYDGFGNILESREDITNRILYTGQQYDQETGQYYLRARYYNPVIGRFTQEDTYRGDGLNLYAYCDNNPVMYYDPSGHDNTSNGGCKVTGDGEEQGQTQVNRTDKGNNQTEASFSSDKKLNDHFEKHGKEFEGEFSTAEEYLQGARDVMKNGYKVEYTYKNEPTTGYVQFMGNTSKKDAKFAFVGTNNIGEITTFHTKSGSSLWKMLNDSNIPVINPK